MKKLGQFFVILMSSALAFGQSSGSKDFRRLIYPNTSIQIPLDFNVGTGGNKLSFVFDSKVPDRSSRHYIKNKYIKIQKTDYIKNIKINYVSLYSKQLNRDSGGFSSLSAVSKKDIFERGLQVVLGIFGFTEIIDFKDDMLWEQSINDNRPSEELASVTWAHQSARKLLALTGDTEFFPEDMLEIFNERAYDLLQRHGQIQPLIASYSGKVFAEISDQELLQWIKLSDFASKDQSAAIKAFMFPIDWQSRAIKSIFSNGELNWSFVEVWLRQYGSPLAELVDPLFDEVISRDTDVLYFIGKIPLSLSPLRRAIIDKIIDENIAIESQELSDMRDEISDMTEFAELAEVEDVICSTYSAYRGPIMEILKKQYELESLLGFSRIPENLRFENINWLDIESVRKDFNSCSASNLGDEIVFSLLFELAKLKLSIENYESAYGFLEGFSSFIGSGVQKDVRSFYQTFAGFIATSIANYFVENEGRLRQQLGDEYWNEKLTLLEDFGVNIQLSLSNSQKAWRSLRQGQIGYVASKAVIKMSAKSGSLVNKECSGNFSLSGSFALEGGFETRFLKKASRAKATLIRSVTPEARLNYEVGVGGTVTTAYIRSKYGENLVGSAVASYSVAMKPSQLAIIDGQLASWLMAQGQKGLVIIDNNTGKLRIENINHVSVNDKSSMDVLADFNDFMNFINLASEKSWDVFQGHLLVEKSNIRVNESWDQSRDKRRLLIQFQGGEFGVFDVEGRVSLYEAACLALKFPGVVSAVNLDTGMYDIASFVDPGGQMFDFGTPDKQRKDTATNKIIFHY